jgi:hypothetical protein
MEAHRLGCLTNERGKDKEKTFTERSAPLIIAFFNDESPAKQIFSCIPPKYHG